MDKAGRRVVKITSMSMGGEGESRSGENLSTFLYGWPLEFITKLILPPLDEKKPTFANVITDSFHPMVEVFTS